MPYRTNADLPVSVQALPPHAQDIYREAFNHAFAAHVGDLRQEETAHRIAWAAAQTLICEDRGQSGWPLGSSLTCLTSHCRPAIGARPSLQTEKDTPCPTRP